jgi:hypothetical protein
VEEHRSDSCCCCLFGLICLAFMLAVRFASTHWSTQTDRETCRQQMVPQYANVPFKVRVLYNSQSRNGLSWVSSPYVGIVTGHLSFRLVWGTSQLSSVQNRKHRTGHGDLSERAAAKKHSFMSEIPKYMTYKQMHEHVHSRLESCSSNFDEQVAIYVSVIDGNVVSK